MIKKIKILSLMLSLSVINFSENNRNIEIMQPELVQTQMRYDLKFDESKYTTQTSTINGKIIKYRAYENIVYVSNPIDLKYQTMNIYIPEEYFNNKKINGYSRKTAPIFMPNTVGGYMPGAADKPGNKKDENPNSLIKALARGYVVASPGARGRNLEKKWEIHRKGTCSYHLLESCCKIFEI